MEGSHMPMEKTASKRRDKSQKGEQIAPDDDSGLRPAQRRRQLPEPPISKPDESRANESGKPKKNSMENVAESSPSSLASRSRFQSQSAMQILSSNLAPETPSSSAVEQQADPTACNAPVWSPEPSLAFTRTRSSSQSIASMAAAGEQTPIPPSPSWTSLEGLPSRQEQPAALPPREPAPAPAPRPGREGPRAARPSDKGFARVWSDESRARAVDPDRRLDDLLAKLHFKFSREETEVLQRAYCCAVCHDADATCHQIRAVYDAFNLAWSEEKASPASDAAMHASMQKTA